MPLSGGVSQPSSKLKVLVCQEITSKGSGLMHLPETGCSLTFAEMFILKPSKLISAASGFSIKGLILNDVFMDSSKNRLDFLSVS